MLSLTGQRFGRLVALERTTNMGVATRWRCLCDCGNELIARTKDLRSGNHKSCGCLRLEAVTTHGDTIGARLTGVAVEYSSWYGMLQRCNNPANDRFKDYGGRGIQVCERWNLYENFLVDMGRKPEPAEDYSIERLDNDGDYEPSNCVWAHFFEQHQNQRHSNQYIVGKLANF